MTNTTGPFLNMLEAALKRIQKEEYCLLRACRTNARETSTGSRAVGYHAPFRKKPKRPALIVLAIIY